MHVPLQRRELPPAGLVSLGVQRVTLGHVVSVRRGFNRLLGSLELLTLRVRVRVRTVLGAPVFLGVHVLIVVVNVDEVFHVVTLVALARLTNRVPVAGLEPQKLRDEHEGAARERSGRVSSHLEESLDHRRSPRRLRVVLQGSERQRHELTRRSAGPTRRAGMKQHGVESAVEPVGNSRARREQLQEKGERLERTAEVRRVRDGEKRRGYLLHQRLDRVCVDVGKRPVDAGEESGDDSGVDAGAQRRRRSPEPVQPIGFLGASTPPARSSTAAPTSPTAAPALLRTVAPPLLLVIGSLFVVAILRRAAVLRRLLAPLVKHIEHAEVKLDELCGEFLPLARVIQRELVEQHRRVVLSLEPDAAAEAKRLNLPRHDALHRGVVLADELQQQVRGVRCRPSVRVSQLVHEDVQQTAFLLGRALEHVVRSLDGFFLEHWQRISAQRIERVDEPRVRALDHVLDVPKQQPLALQWSSGGLLQRLFGEIPQLSVRRQERVAEKFLQSLHSLHRTALASLDPGLLQQREQGFQRLHVRHGILLRQHGGGGDLIRGGTASAHELEPFGIRGSRPARLFLVHRDALLQRLTRRILLGVHLTLR